MRYRIARTVLFVASFVLFATSFFAFTGTAHAQLTLPVPFDISGSLAPRAATLSGQTAVSFSSVNGIYSFSYSEGGNALARYELNTTDPDVQKGLLKVKEAVTNSFPMTQAGPSYRKLDGTVLTPRQFVDGLDPPGGASGATFVHQQFGNIVSFLITHTIEGVSNTLRYDFEMKGKTLVVHAYAVNPRSGSRGNYAGFTFGRSEQTPSEQVVLIPYQDTLSPIRKAGPAGGEFFFVTYPDYTRSNSNEAFERFDTAGNSVPGGSSVWATYNPRYIPGQNDAYLRFNK